MTSFAKTSRSSPREVGGGELCEDDGLTLPPPGCSNHASPSDSPWCGSAVTSPATSRSRCPTNRHPPEQLRPPTEGAAKRRCTAWIAANLAPSCSLPSTSIAPTPALAVLLGLNGLRVSEACGTNVEDLGFQRGHRTLRILGQATASADPSGAAGRPDASTSPWSTRPRPHHLPPRRASASTAAPLVGGCDPSASEPGWAPCTHICSRAGFIMAALDAGVPRRDVQIGHPSHADPPRRPSMPAERTSTATPAYVEVASIAGG